MSRMFQGKLRTLILVSFLIFATATLVPLTTVAAATEVTVTVNPQKTVAINNFTIGYQLEGADVGAWVSRSTLRGLAQSAGFKLVRFFNYIVEPCTSWSESTRTGSWDWAEVDSLVQKIFETGAEPLIVMGFYNWESGRVVMPRGMTTNPTTSLPYPEQWGAYSAEWVRHFRAKGLPVRYYEIINEPNQYFGWPATQPKLSYYMDVYNSAATSMRRENPDVMIGCDNSTFKKVLDYFIAYGEKLDFLSYHAYATASLSASDAEILAAAETKYIGETTSLYGVVKARQVYYNAKGVLLPVFKTENNINSNYGTGSDPRTQKMLGAVYNALTFRSFVLNDVRNNIYFHFSSSKTDWERKTSGGFGFGMINLDDNRPWYPYYAHSMIGKSLGAGDRVIETASSSSDVRSIAWIHEGQLMILLICKVDEQRAVSLNGLSGPVNYTKIDNTVSWLNPGVQTGRTDAAEAIIMNGYTVMLLQAQVEGEQPTDPPASSLTVASPDGGQKWIRGTIHNMTWSSTGSPGANVEIELLKAGVVNMVLTSSTPNDGSYSWTISSTQAPGIDYEVRITSTMNTGISDSSNSNFAIVAGTLTVTSPNGGQSWVRGTSHTITWSKSGSPGSYVKIELLKGGVVNRVLTSSTPNDGSYGWTISSTQTTGTDYRVRITSTRYTSISDSSNSNFAITK